MSLGHFRPLEDFDGLKTPTMQSPQLLEIAAVRDLTGISFLDEELWGGTFKHQDGSDDQVAPMKASPVDYHSTSGPPRRRQRTSNASNQSRPVKYSDFDREHCAEIGSSLKRLFPSKHGLEKEQSASIRHESPAPRKTEGAIAENEIWTSVERRVFEMLA